MIPRDMTWEILHKLHSEHQGVGKCRVRALQAVWWQGLSVHIRQIVENCNMCSQHRTEQREPLLTTPVQDSPWQRVSSYLFFWENKSYLLTVDYFSRCIEVAHLKVASAEKVVAALKDVFSCHGTPETIMSDNGLQYSSSLFRTFAMEYGCGEQPQIPTGQREAVKGLWKGGGDKTKVLQTNHATSLESGFSPVQLLMGRQICFNIPQLPAALRPWWPNI